MWTKITLPISAGGSVLFSVVADLGDATPRNQSFTYHTESERRLELLKFPHKRAKY